ncbi:MAG TPA: hypothetical protein VJN42_07610 [Candidatus Acidoferrum sp.]|nr:hypothetical protein [Candidatus Acidoferrum sp.]
MMSVRAHMPAYGWLHGFRNASVRTGIYVGVLLAAFLSGWVIVANRAPFFDRFALLRNVAAIAVLGLIAAIPVLRFWRMPGNLLASSLVGWVIVCLTYRALCMGFSRLDQRMSAVQMFMLGAVLYLLAVTLSWIGTIIRRARRADEQHSRRPG